MAQVRKSGQDRNPIAQAVERAFAEGRQESAAGAPGDEEDGRTPTPRSTQSIITATSFLGSDPFLPKASNATRSPAPDDSTDDDHQEDPSDH